MEFTEAPPIATPVLFYEHGDARNAPKPAVVLESNSRGALRIGLLPHAGGEIDVKIACYHITNPILKDDTGAPTIGAQRSGGWDYHPWFIPPQHFEVETGPGVENCHVQIQPTDKHDPKNSPKPRRGRPKKVQA